MRRMGLLVLSLGILLISSARAEEWSKTFMISGHANLKVLTSDANITVGTWDQNTIQAHVTTEHYKIGEGGITIRESQNGDSVQLEVKYPHPHFGINRGRVDIEIQMPRQGQVNLHTGDGSIRLANLKGNMELDSGDGNLEISSVDGTLKAHTGDGHIRAEGRFDGVEIATGDGHVETRVEKGSSLGSGWDLQTGDGNVSVELPSNFAADLELQSGDGHISLDVPVTVEGRLESNHVRGKLNGGGAPLRVRTGDGSIALKSAGV
jgi:DUF4097 and DUF4098 domain-containing protein YvlB